jgi:hypothetical protein
MTDLLGRLGAIVAIALAAFCAAAGVTAAVSVGWQLRPGTVALLSTGLLWIATVAAAPAWLYALVRVTNWIADDLHARTEARASDERRVRWCST